MMPWNDEAIADILSSSIARRLERLWPQADFNVLLQLSRESFISTTRRIDDVPEEQRIGCMARVGFCAALDTTRRNPHDLYAVSLDAVVRKVARRLNGAYDIPKDESEGWAQLGIATAINKLRPAAISAAIDPTRWLAGHLAAKGYHAAVDALRSAGEVARKRNGALYGRRIKPVSGQQLPEPAAPISDNDAADFVEAAFSRLNADESTLFQLRYIEAMSFTAIAGRVGMTACRLYQIHAAALEKLREQLLN